MLIAIFLVNHYALNKIITHSKWKVLNTIQAQIEMLQTQEQILSEKTLEHLNKLSNRP